MLTITRPNFIRKLSLLFVFFQSIMVHGQSLVTIVGEAPFASNEEIRLLVFEDLLNNVPTTVASSKIDKNGTFKLQYKTNQIQLVQLAIRTTKAEMFIVPNQTYDLNISTDTVLFNMLNPERYGGFLQITNNKIDTNDLNYKINRFSHFFGRAMDYYGFRITYDHDRAAYDTITDLLHNKFNIQYDPLNFYTSYLYYTCGLLDRICMSKERDLFYQNYFNNDYILYNNPAYMMLFAENYRDYLYNSPHISKALLSRTINDDPDYFTLFNETGKDPMLTNERLRELVLIYNLIGFQNNEEFDRGNVVKLLQHIKKNSHFPEHIIYIDNALKGNTSEGKLTKDLVFKNSKGDKVTLKSLGEENIFIHFFQSDCIDCIREMMILQELNKRYGDKIRFVSVNLDPDVEHFKKFCRQYENMFDWSMLYFNHQYDWVMNNGVETLPDYLILSPNGKVIDRYLPHVESGLSDYLQARYPKEEKEEKNPLFR